MTSRPGFFRSLKITYAGQLVDPGRCIRRMRTNLGWSQSELAKRANLTPGYISQIELNKIEAPTRTYQAIARAMGLRLDQMWGLA